MNYLASLRLWLYGLLSTAISAAAGVTALSAIDPLTFNYRTGLRTMAEVAGAMAIIAILNYLQKHPLPAFDVMNDDKLPTPPASSETGRSQFRGGPSEKE